MEIIAVVFMLVAGGALAVFVVAAMSLASRENERNASREAAAAPKRDAIAASLLVHVVAAGGVSLDDATRQVRRGTGIAAPITPGIDVASWAESYARVATQQQRLDLLESAVQLVASRSPVPVRQYAALLDLSFGLGFQTDALARLRELYGFEYVDHAKDARPRSADRAGGGAPLFVRETRPREELLIVLGVREPLSRHDLTAAYRRLVSENHPDRFHGATAEAQTAAAGRFIEITKAYEELIRVLKD
jgi:DnaJ-domain-containing protein 1